MSQTLPSWSAAVGKNHSEYLALMSVMIDRYRSASAVSPSSSAILIANFRS
ncbi:Uncharacterised protein [Mycobacteroides abscessus]|nr:Uncharacterised protein [Mycobacteroides abscessus]